MAHEEIIRFLAEDKSPAFELVLLGIPAKRAPEIEKILLFTGKSFQFR